MPPIARSLLFTDHSSCHNVIETKDIDSNSTSRITRSMAYPKYDRSTVSTRNEFKRGHDKISRRSTPYWGDEYNHLSGESNVSNEPKPLDYDISGPQYKRHISHNVFWRHRGEKKSCEFIPSDMFIEKEPVDISRISINPLAQENVRNSAQNNRIFSSQMRPRHSDESSLYPQTPRCNEIVLKNASEHREEGEFKCNDHCDEAPTLSRGLTGLDNLGNTCFLNSALQCLVHTQTLSQYFASGTYGNDIMEKSPMGGQLATTFAKVCGGIYQQPSYSSVNPLVLKDVISNWAPQFTGYNQQDAHELLRFLLDGLSEDLKRHAEVGTPSGSDMSEDDLFNLTPEEQGEYWWDRHISKNSSFITDEFCGQLMSTIECLECHERRYCFDPMYDLSLPMPGEAQSVSFFGRRTFRRTSSRYCSDAAVDEDCSLNDCLKMFMKEEILDGQNMSYCAKCKKRQRTHKSLNLHRLPNTLVVHLKRFGNSRRKKENKISYPLSDLNLHPFTSKNTRSGITRSSMYDLYAVCHHIGTSYSGHYTASCLDKESNEWYEFNDSKVSRYDRQLSPCTTPYMLFYRLRQ